MLRRNIPQAEMITTRAGVEALVREFQGEALIAIDTESNNMYAYRERVCLVQLSSRRRDVIIDPLADGIDLAPLGALFADPAIEKVFHAAEYDVMCLKRDFGFHFTNLFDTMLAARICGGKTAGLNVLVERFIGIKLDKSHQRDNWGERPLTEAMLLYAQLDTHYLPALRDALTEQLTALGRLEEAREVFDGLPHIPAARVHTFDPEGFWRIALPKNLRKRETAVLRELYALREELAERRDRPVFKIFSDKTLVALAQAQPTTKADLYPIEGMSKRVIARDGDRLLAAIERGMSARPPKPPRPPAPNDPQVVDRYAALRAWRRRRAEERGVESDVIIAKESLWALAEQMPTTRDQLALIPGIGAWRLAMYGEELLAELARLREAP